MRMMVMMVLRMIAIIMTMAIDQVLILVMAVS